MPELNTKFQYATYKEVAAIEFQNFLTMLRTIYLYLLELSIL